MAMRLSLNLRKVQPERLPTSSLARPSFGVLTGLDEVIDEMTDMGDGTVGFGPATSNACGWNAYRGQ